jgi:transcriptional regulator with XRE-family HTH domain
MKNVVATPFPADPWMKDAAGFGSAIRAARTGAGLSLTDAALALGLSKQTLSDLETAKASVGLASALKVAQQLGVAVFAVTADEREPVRRAIVGVRQAAPPERAAGDSKKRKTGVSTGTSEGPP